MEITRGKIAKPTKATFYGIEGWGKTTLASLLPNSLFTDVEGGTSRIDVARTPRPTTWAQFQQINADLVKDTHGFTTWVIDTGDWLEKLLIAQVCAELGIPTLGTCRKGDKDASWGASYNKLDAMWSSMLTQLEADFIDTNRMNIVFLCHGTTRKFEVPEEEGAYDKYELSMEKKTSKSLREWSEMLLFLNYQTIVNVDATTKKAKASGGANHIIYTEHTAFYDAKNRFELPRSFRFDRNSDGTFTLPAPLADIFSPKITGAIINAPAPPAPKPAEQPKAAPPAPATPPVQTPAPGPTENTDKTQTHLTGKHRDLQVMLDRSGVTFEQVMAVAAARGKAQYPQGTPIENIDPDFIAGWIEPYWQKILEMIEQMKGEAA